MAFAVKRRSRALAVVALCAVACSLLQWSLGGSMSQLALAEGGGASPDQQQMQAAYEKIAQIWAAVNQHHRDTVAKVVGILAVKIVLLHFVTVRTRVMQGNMKRSANSGSAWEEDERMPGWFAAVMKAILVCVGPVPSEGFLARLQGLVGNTLETEPFFIGLAVAYGLRGVSSVYAVRYATTLMWAFVAGRIAHAVAFLLALPQPSRALPWMVAIFSMLGLAVIVFI